MNIKKSLLAVVFASVFVAPVAMAEATVYGVMHMSYDRVSDGAASAGSSVSKTNQLTSNESRLGFRGSESIGGDLSAIWQIESEITADTGGDTLATRNTYLGLKSDSMGTLKAGIHDTPYKMATRNLDVFKETSADNRSLMGQGFGGSHDVRLSNIVVYASPSMGGFSVAAATLFGAEGATSGDTKGSAFSVAGMFDMGGIYATVAIDKLKAGSNGSGDLAANGSIFNGAAVGDKEEAVKVGGGYSMDMFAVNGVIENLKFKEASSGGSAKNTNIYLGGKFSISSSDAIKVAFTKRGKTKFNDGLNDYDGAKQYALGYDHKFNDRAMVYALYTRTNYDDDVSATPVDLGDNPSVISFGMRLDF